MILSFLGHQSWLISCGNTHILIDPLLKDSFGNADDNGIEIYPPRSIDIEAMPPISAIILSHEHSDHFHLPSLNLFPGVPIFFGPLMPRCVQQILKDHGFKCQCTPFFSTIVMGDLQFSLYPAAPETVLWESRVTQIYLANSKKPEDAAFIAVDALVAKEFKNDIEDRNIHIPKLIALSNNSQVTPKGVLGSLDNFQGSEGYTLGHGIKGLSLLHELLISYMEELEEIDNVAICGGGFTKKYDTQFGPFLLSDQNELARVANMLSSGKKVYGPLPGETITITNKQVCLGEPVAWVKLNEARLQQLINQATIFASKNRTVQIRPTLQVSINHDYINIVNNLNRMAKSFMLSRFGHKIVSLLASSEKFSSPYGFLVKFALDSSLSNWCTYALNFNKGAFEKITHNKVSTPYGIELFMSDFIGLISGEIQIWDLGGISMRAWYPDEEETVHSPVAFMYSYFGEQVNNQLNYKCYKKRWAG